MRSESPYCGPCIYPYRYLDYRDKTPKDQVIEWLRSNEGEQYIEAIMKRITEKTE
jgi:hypothetical protein